MVRLAVEAKLVSFALRDNVAIVEKKPIWVTTGCKLRVGRLGWKSDFLVRGGVKLFPVDKVTTIDGKTYHITAERKMKYGMIMVADAMLPSARFEHPLVIRQGYLVFEIVGKDARLVDAEPTHVMMVFKHEAHFRRAVITFKGEGEVVYNDWNSCGQKSIAMMIVTVPMNRTFVVCYNTSGTRHRCYEVTATLPPVINREFFA